MLHTKEEYRECLKKIIMPTLKYYTPGNAGIKCGVTGVQYGEQIARMEGFARMLWGLAPFWGGGGECKEFDDLYVNGLINGTDPQHEEYWGNITDYDQRIVESGAIGLSLVLAPEKIWNPLTNKQKERLYKWLDQVNQVKSCNNNWQFFAVLVNIGLKNVGMPFKRDVINHSISKVHSFYRKNGWYTDGNTDQADYYISFALHFYGLIYAKVMEDDDPENSRIFKNRAEKFAKDFIYWFAEDGSALAFGRSLTYRFAQCCFWSACVFAGIEPFPIGVIKGIISRNLEWWLKQPIFDNGGILTIGYAYPNICMSEGYNAYGSVYWALKTFLILSLNDEHRFYKETAQPLPKLNNLRVIPEARMVIQRIKGNVIALTAGQWAAFEPIHVAEKYSKFAYSSKYAFSIPRSYYGLENSGSDSMLVFIKENMCYVRRKCIEYEIQADATVYSKWIPYQGITVETYIVPTVYGHKRKHIVTCDEPCVGYDCSFAMADSSGYIIGSGEKVLIRCAPNTNLISPETKIEAIKYHFGKGKTCVESEIVYFD